MQMKQSVTQIQKINSAIQKAISKTKRQYQCFAQDFFTKVNPKNFDEATKIFQDALHELNNILKESMNRILQKAQYSLQNQSCINVQGQPINKSLQSISQIIVNKKEDKQNYLELENEQKAARMNFFTHTLKQKLSKAQISKQNQNQIVQLLTQWEQTQTSELTIDLDNLGKLSEYRQIIQQLINSFNAITQQFSRKRRDCPEIVQILQLKLTTLTVISLQYNLNGYQQYRSSVSSFELFKVIHDNRELSSVTIKGIHVAKFQQFVKVMAQSKKSLNQEQSWIKSFRPQRPLKLLIDAQAGFSLQDNEETLRSLSDLRQFVELFDSVSDIKVRIVLGEQKEALEHLVEHLKKLKKIKITIQGRFNQYFDLLLGGFASLTEICFLELTYINFHRQRQINRLLAMEQTLKIIFSNNKITQLKLYRCQNLPIFPKIPCLQKVFIWFASFRRQLYFANELARNSQQLKNIKYYIGQKWMVQEQLFNQLQQLQISNSSNITLNISTQSPSKIKSLTLSRSNISSACLSVLFPKLEHLTYIFINDLHFGHQVLCNISSPHLEKLMIDSNYQFVNQGLEAVDRKWPYLRQMLVWGCINISDNEDGWGACQFKGLRKLWIDPQNLASGHRIRQQFRGRGIKVYQQY